MVPFHMDFFLLRFRLSSFYVFFFFLVGSFVWKSKCQDRAVQKERHFLSCSCRASAQTQPAIMLSTMKRNVEEK